MGNSEKQNENFSKNFNWAQHNKKMDELNRNYQSHQFAFTDYTRNTSKKAKVQSFEQMSRKNAIFKPSINISMKNGFSISFQYCSRSGCQLTIYLGVNNIIQHEINKNTIQIQADFQFQEYLAAGNQSTFKKSYPNFDKKLLNKLVIIRVYQDQQATQISMRRVNQTQQHWKIILEKLQIKGKVYELENIYGGGNNGQQCIICMSEPSNTIVKPCNHLCLCKQCANIMGNKEKKCPICRNLITELVTVNATSQ